MPPEAAGRRPPRRRRGAGTAERMRMSIAFALLLAATACRGPRREGAPNGCRHPAAGGGEHRHHAADSRSSGTWSGTASPGWTIDLSRSRGSSTSSTPPPQRRRRGYNQDRMQELLTRLGGAVEEQQHQLQLSDQRLAELQSDTEARFAASRGRGARGLRGAKRAEAEAPHGQVRVLRPRHAAGAGRRACRCPAALRRVREEVAR